MSHIPGQHDADPHHPSGERRSTPASNLAAHDPGADQSPSPDENGASDDVPVVPGYTSAGARLVQRRLRGGESIVGIHAYRYLVTVETDTEEHGDQVIAERIGPDEDYGFPYRIGWEGEPSLEDRFDLVEGQEAIDHCGCGEVIIKYEGVWYHAYNPALIGADDHTASPA